MHVRSACRAACSICRPLQAQKVAADQQNAVLATSCQCHLHRLPTIPAPWHAEVELKCLHHRRDGTCYSSCCIGHGQVWRQHARCHEHEQLLQRHLRSAPCPGAQAQPVLRGLCPAGPRTRQHQEPARWLPSRPGRWSSGWPPAGRLPLSPRQGTSCMLPHAEPWLLAGAQEFSLAQEQPGRPPPGCS